MLKQSSMLKPRMLMEKGDTTNQDNKDGENGKDKNGGQDGENNGLLGADDPNNKNGKGNSGLNDSNDSLNRKKKRTCLQRAGTCLCKTLAAIGAAAVKCGKYLFNSLSSFLHNFFFLKNRCSKKSR